MIIMFAFSFNNQSVYPDKVYRSFQGDSNKVTTPSMNYSENAYCNLTTMTDVNPDLKSQSFEFGADIQDSFNPKPSSYNCHYKDQSARYEIERIFNSKCVEALSRSSSLKRWTNQNRNPNDSFSRSRMTHESMEPLNNNKSNSLNCSALRPYWENFQTFEYNWPIDKNAQEPHWNDNQNWWCSDAIKKVSEKFNYAKQIYEKQILELKVDSNNYISALCSNFWIYLLW